MAASIRSTRGYRRIVKSLTAHIAELDRRIAGITGADERGFPPYRRQMPLQAARSIASLALINLWAETWRGGSVRPDPQLAAVYEDLARIARGELA